MSKNVSDHLVETLAYEGIQRIYTETGIGTSMSLEAYKALPIIKKQVHSKKSKDHEP